MDLILHAENPHFLNWIQNRFNQEFMLGSIKTSELAAAGSQEACSVFTAPPFLPPSDTGCLHILDLIRSSDKIDTGTRSPNSTILWSYSEYAHNNIMLCDTGRDNKILLRKRVVNILLDTGQKCGQPKYQFTFSSLHDPLFSSARSSSSSKINAFSFL